MKTPKHLCGQALQEIRKYCEFRTAAEAAAALDIAPSTYVHWENGRKALDIDDIAMIANKWDLHHGWVYAKLSCDRELTETVILGQLKYGI